MTSEILLSARKLSCTLTLLPTTLDWLLSLTLLPTTLDWLLSVTEECGDLRVEREEGRTSAEGSGEEGTWPALAGRSLYRKHKTHKIQLIISSYILQHRTIFIESKVQHNEKCFVLIFYLQATKI